MAEDWAIDVRKYVPNADSKVIDAIVRYCGIALHNRDSSLVSYTEPEELRRVRENYLKKKLGMTHSDAELDEAIAEVGDRTRQSIVLVPVSKWGSGEKFDIETGLARPVRGYSTGNRIAGTEDRWRITFGTFEMARAVEAAYRTADLETMREVCRLLGVKAPIGWNDQ